MKTYIRRLFAPLVHPVGGFDDYRERRFFPLLPSLIVLALFFFARVAQQQLTGFIFNWDNPQEMNIWFILLETIGLFVIWVGCNWAVSTLLDGKGRFREIWVVSAVALIPYVAGVYLEVLMSNLLLEDEGTFMTWVVAVGMLYSVLLMFGALSVIHEYTIGKVLWSCLLTLAFMVIILFVCVLLFSLFQQVIGFFEDLYTEIRFRL